MRLLRPLIPLLLLAAPVAAEDWRAPCVAPSLGLQTDAQMQARALEAAFACMQMRIEELEQENAAMRARMGAAERLAREAMALIRAAPEEAPATN